MKLIHHVVDVPAPVQALWEAITTEQGLSDWWTTSVEAPSPEVGGVLRFSFRPGFNPEMEVILLERPHRVHWRCIGGHDAWQGSIFRFEIEQRHETARLRFWQISDLDLTEDAYGTYNFNWAYYLQSLYELVTTGVGKPFRA